MLGFAAFLCVSLGGLAIGLFCGALSAFITRFTEYVRVVEPVVLFGMAYLAYMCSELFHFSGIIGIIACGLFQSHYSCSNIASKSYISVTYFAKVFRISFFSVHPFVDLLFGRFTDDGNAMKLTRGATFSRIKRSLQLLAVRSVWGKWKYDKETKMILKRIIESCPWTQ